MKKILFSALAAFLVLGAAFFIGEKKAEAPLQEGSIVQTSDSYKRAQVTIGNRTFSALVSDTPELRALGLGGRQPLGSDEAMLFVFDEPESSGFWMKGMLFSIDIVWIDESGRIITVASDVSPDTYPDAFFPARPASYVVELLAGTMESLGVKEGDRVQIGR